MEPVAGAESVAGEISGPKHLLGTLHTSGDATEFIFKRPDPTNPTLRGTDTLPPKTNGVPRFKFLPVEIVDRPVQFSKNPTPASNKVLALHLASVRMLVSARALPRGTPS